MNRPETRTVQASLVEEAREVADIFDTPRKVAFVACMKVLDKIGGPVDGERWSERMPVRRALIGSTSYPTISRWRVPWRESAVWRSVCSVIRSTESSGCETTRSTWG